MQFTANCQSAKRTRKHSATTQTVYLEISGLVGFSTFFYVYSLCWSVWETQTHLQHACALSVWTSANIQVQGLLLACHRSLPGACPLLQVPVNSKASPGSSADWVCLYHGRWNRSFALSECAESLSSVFGFEVVLSLYTNRSESTHSAQPVAVRVLSQWSPLSSSNLLIWDEHVACMRCFTQTSDYWPASPSASGCPGI